MHDLILNVDNKEILNEASSIIININTIFRQLQNGLLILHLNRFFTTPSTI